MAEAGGMMVVAFEEMFEEESESVAGEKLLFVVQIIGSGEDEAKAGNKSKKATNPSSLTMK